MKFVCNKCRTKYTIADEKVRGKVLKIRCKNCGTIIEVREPSTRPSTGIRTPKKPSSTGALKAMSRHGGTRKRSSAVAKLTPSGPISRSTGKSTPIHGARADRSQRAPALQPRQGRDRGAPAGLGKRPAGVPAGKRPAGVPAGKPPVPARDGDPKTVVAAMPKELLDELRSGGAAPQAAIPADDDGGWFLGDDRGEYGPMTFAELAARCQRGEPGPNAEAWKEGFGDWLPLEEIQPLTPSLKVAPPPRPGAGAQPAPAPASPYQKTPRKDAAQSAPLAPPKAPLPAKVTPAAPVDDSLVKIPAAAPSTTASPPPPEGGWPELPPIEPSAATPVPQSAAAALAPEPFLPASAVATPSAAALPGAHVSPATSSPELNPQLADLKRDRRPVLLIGAGVLVLSIAVVVLVVYLISSSSKPSKDSSGATAEAGMSMKPPMRAATTNPLPMAATPATMEADDSTELDLDIDVSTGRVSKHMGRRRRTGVMKTAEPMTPMRAASSGSLYGLPTMRAGFVGLMGFGTMSMRSTPSSSGGRPGDLRSVIKRNYNRLRRCYEKAARLNSRIKNPRLRITVKVSSSGRCRNVYVSPSRHQSNGLGICIRRTIMSWRWPTFSASYRWTFSARFSSS